MLQIFLPMAKGDLLITARKSSFLSFWSDHPQNVIDGMFIFPNLQAAKFPKDTATAETIRGKMESQTELILTIEPVAGPRLVCSAQQIIFATNADLTIPKKTE